MRPQHYTNLRNSNSPLFSCFMYLVLFVTVVDAVFTFFRCCQFNANRRICTISICSIKCENMFFVRATNISGDDATIHTACIYFLIFQARFLNKNVDLYMSSICWKSHCYFVCIHFVIHSICRCFHNENKREKATLSCWINVRLICTCIYIFPFVSFLYTRCLHKIWIKLLYADAKHIISNGNSKRWFNFIRQA